MISLCLAGKDKCDILERSPYISNSVCPEERTEYFNLLDGRKACVIELKGSDGYILRDLGKWEQVLILRNGTERENGLAQGG